MNESFDPSTFELLVHLLEVSVVLGIGVIIYITKRHSRPINRRLEERMKDEMDTPSN